MYIQIDRDDIWDVYTKESAVDGLYRGGGNGSTPRMYKSENGAETVRPADFKILFDNGTGEYVVYPDITKGLSFSNSLQRLKDIPIKGKVWLLPRNADLPEGLVINYKTLDHPLLNVGKKMSVGDLVVKLKQLEKSMKATGVSII